MDVLDVMTAKNVFGGKELAITRCGKTVSVTYLSKPSTLKTLRAAPPAGCDVQPISRLEALKTLAMEPTLDGVVLLRAILSPALQYGY